MELPQLAAVGQLHGLLEIRNTSPLRTRLENAAGPLHRVVEPLTKIDGQAARLFAVDILAGLGGHHRGRRVPAISRGDQHGIDIFAVEQLAKVARDFAVAVSVTLIDQCLARLDDGLPERRQSSHTARRACASIGWISYVQRGPMPITPNVILSLGGTVPSAPSTEAGKNRGHSQGRRRRHRILRNCRRVDVDFVVIEWVPCSRSQ